MERPFHHWTRRKLRHFSKAQVNTYENESNILLLFRTEIEITAVQAANAEDVDRAVRAARIAFKASSWKKLSATERGRLLVRLSELIEQNKELFASIDAWDNGECCIDQRAYPFFLVLNLTSSRENIRACNGR